MKPLESIICMWMLLTNNQAAWSLAHSVFRSFSRFFPSFSLTLQNVTLFILKYNSLSFCWCLCFLRRHFCWCVKVWPVRSLTMLEATGYRVKYRYTKSSIIESMDIQLVGKNNGIFNLRSKLEFIFNQIGCFFG